MADAIPPTSPTPVTGLLGTASAPADNLGGSTINVGSNPGDLQAYLDGTLGGNAALNANGTHKGNTYVVPAGVTYNDVTVPTAVGAGWTCIRTSSGSLPAVGTRVSSANAAAMFKISALGERALTIQNTEGWRIIGMEAAHSANSFHFGLIDVLGAARTLFERCYIHGQSTTTPLRRCMFVLNSDDFQIWDSWLDEAKEQGADSQAIFFRNNTRGHVENCELQGGAECVMLGDEASAIRCSDFTLKRNHFFKPLKWRQLLGDGSANPTYAGYLVSIKNNFEIKSGARVLVEGNIMENCWAQGQDGSAILYNAGTSATLNLPTIDVMTRHNIVKSANAMFSVNSWQTASLQHARLAYLNNLGLDIRGRMVLFLHKQDDIWMEHNTCVIVGTQYGFLVPASVFMAWDAPGNFPRHTLKNNVFGKSVNGITLQGATPTTAALDTYIPDRSWGSNHQYGSTGTSPLDGIVYETTASAVGLDTATGILNSSSSLKGAATDGTDVGVNFTTLDAAQTGTVIAGDTTLPTIPANLAVSGSPLSSSFTETWSAATDNVAVGSYNLQVTDTVTGVVEVFTTTALTFSVTGRVASRQYSTKIQAVDTSGNPSGYSSAVLVTTAAAPAGSAVPPDLMRGFGPVRGISTTDSISIPLTAHAIARTYVLWCRINSTRIWNGTAPCLFDKNTSFATNMERLVMVTGGVSYWRTWSGGEGNWFWGSSSFASGTTRHLLILKDDGASASNTPVCKLDDALLTAQQYGVPAGSLSTNANPYQFGRDFDGDLAKVAVYNFITTDQNDTDLFTGTDPLTIGAGPVAYHAFDGTANEPDTSPSAAGNSTIVGTQVQNYAAAPATTVTLAVSAGDPTTGAAYQVTATTTGTVDRVEFWVGGVLERTDSAAPYTLFASDDVLGAGEHLIEARVFAAAGGSPSDIDTLTVIEPEIPTGTTNYWRATFRLCERDPSASGGYNFYVDGVLTTTVTQTPVGTDPTVTAIFSGNDVRPLLSVSAIYGTTEGPKFSLLPLRYKATTTSGTKPPLGFQELSRDYIP